MSEKDFRKLYRIQNRVLAKLNLYLYFANASNMIPTQILLKQLAPQYFWDVDRDKLDDRRAMRLIIERVVSLGTIAEINLVIHYYGIETVKKVLCRITYLDPKTLHFVSKIFRLPKKRFACYTKNQLHPQFWTS